MNLNLQKKLNTFKGEHSSRSRWRKMAAQRWPFNTSDYYIRYNNGTFDASYQNGTADRYGTLVCAWTSSGAAETVSRGKNGTYYLVETQAPKGHVCMEEPLVFNVSFSGNSRTATIVRHPELAAGTSFSSLNVPNTPLKEYELPHTGGMGTTLFTASGALLMTGAMMYGFGARRKRKGGEA